MRWIIIAGVSFIVGAVARGATILVDPARPTAEQKNELGMQIKLTGPESLPILYGNSEVLGSTMPLLVNTKYAHESSGSATFSQPITSITFDVARANESGWQNLFTIDAYHDGKRVAVSTADLDPVGNGTHISISAPAIDKIDWHGQGWVFHPYTIRNFGITSDSLAVSDPSTPGNIVGASAPEPASATIFGVAAIIFLLRRHRAEL